jgi:uncharacterized membrane protein
MARRNRTPPSVRRNNFSEATEGGSPDKAGGEAIGLPAVVQKEIDQELAKLEPDARVRVRRLVVRVAHEVAEFSGPLPPPSYLRDYETVIVGAADRIIAMAEKEQMHRHDWERSALRNTTIGLWFGFFIALGLLGGAIYSVRTGQPVIAGIFLTASAVGMVPALIKGREYIVQRQKGGDGKPDGKPASPGSTKRTSRSSRYNSN